MNLPVYLVDDDDAVREGLSLLLRTIGIGVRSFAAPGDFLAAFDRLVPGCLVLDIRMPQISGLKLQEKLVERGVNWPTIVISGHGDIESCRLAFRNGAIDFLSKPVDEQSLIDAIQKGHAEMEGRCRQALEAGETRQLLARLTERETHVLEMVAKGLTTKQIAIALSLSPRTVDSHRAAIGTKVGTTSAAELTRLWLSVRDDP